MSLWLRAMLPLQRRLFAKGSQESGSALLLILVIAALLAIAAPLVAQLEVFNAQSAKGQRDLLIKNVAFLGVGRYASSITALQNTLAKSTAAIPKDNNCFRACMGQTDGIDGQSCNEDTEGNTEVHPSLPTHLCVARQGDNTRPTEFARPVWHRFTLYSSAGDKIVGGPDASGTLARYNLDGRLCDTSADDTICPLEVQTYFNPICPGDFLEVAEHQVPRVDGGPLQLLGAMKLDSLDSSRGKIRTLRPPAFLSGIFGSLAAWAGQATCFCDVPSQASGVVSYTCSANCTATDPEYVIGYDPSDTSERMDSKAVLQCSQASLVRVAYRLKWNSSLGPPDRIGAVKDLTSVRDALGQTRTMIRLPAVRVCQILGVACS